MATIQQRGLCALVVDETRRDIHVSSRARSERITIECDGREIELAHYSDLEALHIMLHGILRAVENPENEVT